MAAEPGGVMAAAREGPVAGDAIAAIDRDRPPGARAPGQDAAPVEKDLARGADRQECRYHGADRGLSEAPRRTPVDPGDLLKHRGKGQRVDLGPADGPRQE